MNFHEKMFSMFSCCIVWVCVCVCVRGWVCVCVHVCVCAPAILIDKATPKAPSILKL